MGLPRGWTAASPIPRETLAMHPVHELQMKMRAAGVRRRKVLSLFSGCGGLDFGTSPWFQVVAYCEKDSNAANVIASRISDGSLDRATILPDVKLIQSADMLRDAQGIALGSPRTDFSVAKGPQ